MSFWLRLLGRRPPPQKPKPTKPAPAPPQPPTVRPLIVDAYSFCGHERERLEFDKVPHSQCPHRHPWDIIRTPDRKFAITSDGMMPGTYDEGDHAAMAQILRFMEGGPDSLSHQFEVDWAGMGLEGTKPPEWSGDGYPGKPYMMEHFIKHHIHSFVRVKVSAALWHRIISADDRENYWHDLIAYYGWTPHTMKAAWERLARDVGEWMKAPNWLTVDGKLVFTIGYAHTMPMYTERFPSGEVDLSAANLIRIFREGVREVTGKEVYLMATATPPDFVDPTNESVESLSERMNLKEMGFDGFAPYLLHGIGWEHTMGIYRYWRERDLRAARFANLDYWAAITAGYDGAAWKTEESVRGYRHMPTPAQFEEHVRETMVWATQQMLRGVRIYARGEGKGEGGEIEPMADWHPGNLHVGDEMMRALMRGISRSMVDISR